MSSIPWPLGILLMTWQKFAPLGICASLHLYHLVLILFLAMANSLLGAWGGLNQTQLRPLLAYSSIIHIG